MRFTVKEFNELTTTELYEILKSRSEIFMLEQRIICQDMDDVDYKCRHYFLEDNGRVEAYLRAFYSDEKEKNCSDRQGAVFDARNGLGHTSYE